ncbi:MAG: hypothetical protein GF364_08370 [Candidatus Lokiarchaeota archaeon]|nr:hypothetical protein [Candidatus Lokiarchaeota archaeon]
MYRKSVKRVYRRLFVFGFICIFILTPSFALADTRRSYLLTFILENQNSSNGGFYEYGTDDSSAEDTSLRATQCSVNVLNMLSELEDPQITSSETRLTNYFMDEITPSINDNNTQRLMYSLQGLDLLGKIETIDSPLQNDITEYLASCKEIYGTAIGYAYSPDEELNATVWGTYFIINCYYHLDLLAVVSEAGVSQYLISCIDDASTGKGFKSNISSGEISLVNTFYGLQTLQVLERVSQISEVVRTSIQDYVDSFYVDDENQDDHYGGYAITILNELPFTTMLPTYYATFCRTALFGSNEVLQATKDWVLNLHNPQDGGFMDNVIPGQEQHSSTIISYYATAILALDDPELTILEENVWESDINWWLVVGIIALVSACIVAAIIGYRRRYQI